MKTESQKDPRDEKSPGRRSIGKYVAVATMAASLGVSLGVAVVDALAAEGPGSPPANSKQIKIKNQTDRIKNTGSQQHKESNQGKFKQKAGTKTGESQVNK